MERTLNFNEKRGFICDMDGVIYHGNRILPGVSEFIQWLPDEDKEFLFLTNNSGYPPKELQQNSLAWAWTSLRIISTPVLWRRLPF